MKNLSDKAFDSGFGPSHWVFLHLSSFLHFFSCVKKKRAAQQRPLSPPAPAGRHPQINTSPNHHPGQDKAAGVSGQLVIQFTVEKDGSIADPKVLKSVSPTVDVACIRLVNSMPNWIPGVQKNRLLRVEYTLPITG